MRETTLKLLAIIISITALPALYFSTEEKTEYTITGKVTETRTIRNGQILTITTTLPVVYFGNTSVYEEIVAKGKLSPYKGKIEFMATSIQNAN